MTCPERGQSHVQKKIGCVIKGTTCFLLPNSILFWENRIKKYGEKVFILMG